MIDTLALALGHGLMAIVMLRLMMRTGLDEDPLIADLTAETASNRQAASASGRNAARRTRGVEGEADAPGKLPGAAE
ncbi:MAG: hypothetical protein KAF27_10580 [Porphyrobacter sp.]|nr:hypothetical protein [Porphyrobacter sp.]